MNHEQLNTFMKVMECGSFNKAADVLFVSPSAVMRQVNKLEKELDVKLFDRTSKGLKSTVAGEYYYKEIEKWNWEYENIVKNTKEIAENANLQEVIRVGAYRALSEIFLKDYWGKMQEEFPNTQFDFISYGIYSGQVMNLVNDVGNNVDIVIENYEMWAIEEFNLDVVHLYELPMSCAVSIYSDLYSKDILKLEDLYGKTVSVWNHKRSSIYYDMRTLLGKHPQIKVKDIPFEDERAFDSKNDEILLGQLTWNGINPFYKMIPLDIDYTVPYGIWYRKNPSPKVKAFIEKVKKIEF